MEDSMIVGALETLSEEALEDALEERNLMNRKASNPPVVVNPLSPILSDTEDIASDDKLQPEQMPVLANTPSDVDVLYLRSLQTSPMLHVSAISLSDSMTDVETASLGRLQNFATNLDTPPTICRTKSEEYDSVLIPSSPLRKREFSKGKSNYSAQRPSSLVYESTYIPPNHKNDVSSKSKNNQNSEKLSRKNQEKNNALNHVTNKIKHMRKKSASKSESSSDSSTETEEKVRPKLPTQKTLPTPGSDADGFYSDDEHTPLVSPFHLSRSSHYNLQSSKSEKESTPEKSIPKQSKSDAGPHRKNKKSLERQYSIDSNLCDHSRPPPSSTSMVDIVIPNSLSQYVPVLPAYGQDVSDSSSPELVQVSTVLESQVHNETVL